MMLNYNKKTIMNKEGKALETQGFEGFKSMGELMSGAKSVIPAQMGVYVVLREKDTEPKFLLKGTGGFFKGKDPNVPASELLEHWVEDTNIMYIGKAGGVGSSSTLNKRLGQYLRFGQGTNVGHWGGRHIWQLEDSRELIVCWKALSSEDPRQVEHEMIANFKKVHNGKRPFANLAD